MPYIKSGCYKETMNFTLNLKYPILSLIIIVKKAPDLQI